jgi:hypothetical protein
MCGMITSCDHFGREPYLHWRRPRAAVELSTPRAGRVRARRLKIARHRQEARCATDGSDDGTLSTPGRRWGMLRLDVRPPSDSKNGKQKPASGLLRAGVTIFAMMSVCY